MIIPERIYVNKQDMSKRAITHFQHPVGMVSLRVSFVYYFIFFKFSWDKFYSWKIFKFYRNNVLYHVCRLMIEIITNYMYKYFNFWIMYIFFHTCTCNNSILHVIRGGGSGPCNVKFYFCGYFLALHGGYFDMLTTPTPHPFGIFFCCW